MSQARHSLKAEIDAMLLYAANFSFLFVRVQLNYLGWRGISFSSELLRIELECAVYVWNKG